MEYKDIKKMNPGYMVSELVHNEHFESFNKKYNGFVENHAGKWPCESWRAFEIAFNGGQIGRTRQKDDSADKKASRSFNRKRSSSSSESSSD